MARKQRIRETPRPQCGAGKKDGHPCRSAAGAGTDHLGLGPCSRHGGHLPNVAKAVAKAQGAIYAAERFGGAISQVSPEEALLRELWRANAMVMFLEEKLASWQVGDLDAPVEEWDWAGRDEREQLQAGASIEGVIKVMHVGSDSWVKVTKLQETGLPPMGVTLPGASGGLTVHPSEYQAVLKWSMEERKQLAKVAKMCIDVKIEVRKTQLMASMAAAAIAMARAAVEAVGLTKGSPGYDAAVMRAIQAARVGVAA